MNICFLIHVVRRFTGLYTDVIFRYDTICPILINKTLPSSLLVYQFCSKGRGNLFVIKVGGEGWQGV